MANYSSLITALIASISVIFIMGIYYSYKVKKLSDLLQQAEKNLVELRFRLKKMGSRNGITDSGTLDLAMEITRIENNLSRMSRSSSHYKPLSEAVAKMKSILMEEGYEIIDYLAQPYSSDIKAKVVFYPNEKICEGEAVVFSVQKPQVNYCGKTIQQGHVTVVQSLFLLKHPKWVLSMLYKKVKKMEILSIPSSRLGYG